MNELTTIKRQHIIVYFNWLNCLVSHVSKVCLPNTHLRFPRVDCLKEDWRWIGRPIEVVDNVEEEDGEKEKEEEGASVGIAIVIGRVSGEDVAGDVNEGEKNGIGRVDGKGNGVGKCEGVGADDGVKDEINVEEEEDEGEGEDAPLFAIGRWWLAEADGDMEDENTGVEFDSVILANGRILIEDGDVDVDDDGDDAGNDNDEESTVGGIEVAVPLLVGAVVVLLLPNASESGAFHCDVGGR